MVDVFCCPNITGSSAPVESDFNNLKNRILRNESKPIKVDRFDKLIPIIWKVLKNIKNQLKNNMQCNYEVM